MPPTVHLELSGRSCPELIDVLRQRGLETTVSLTNEHCEIDIRFQADPEKRLRSEVEEAIGTWLARSDAPLVLVSGPEGYILRPPGD